MPVNNLHSPKWTKEQRAELIRLYYERVSVESMASHFGRTKMAIYQQFQYLGLKLYKKERCRSNITLYVTDEFRDRVTGFCHDFGYSITEVVESFTLLMIDRIETESTKETTHAEAAE